MTDAQPQGFDTEQEAKYAMGLDIVADDMTEVFIETSHYNVETGTHYMCEDGYRILHDMFGEIPEKDRAQVFTHFLEKLTARGVRYNTIEFS